MDERLKQFAEALPHSRWWSLNDSTRKPLPHQMAALSLQNVREMLCGSGVGTSKSAYLLFEALLHSDNPYSKTLIVRRTHRSLALEGGLIPKSLEWLSGTPARFNAMESKWTFPSGAVIQFGYCDSERDVYRYGSTEWTAILIDESTELREEDIQYLSSRLRSPHPEAPPFRMRLATNPIGASVTWHRETFVEAPAYAQQALPALEVDG